MIAFMPLIPPQAPLEFTHTSEDIGRLVREIIRRDIAAKDKVGVLSPEKCTFSSVSLPLNL
jgi:hypothetical protein